MRASRATVALATAFLAHVVPVAADEGPDSAEILERIACVEATREIIETGFVEAARIERGSWGELRQALWKADERLRQYEKKAVRPWIDAESQEAVAETLSSGELGVVWQKIAIPPQPVPLEFELMEMTPPRGPETDLEYVLTGVGDTFCAGLLPRNPLLGYGDRQSEETGAPDPGVED